MWGGTADSQWQGDETADSARTVSLSARIEWSPVGVGYLPRDSNRQAATTRFPDTRHSVLEALRDGDPAARRDAAELLVRAYRGPVLASLTWKWQLETSDAEDLVQDFFATALEKQWFDRFDPGKAKFRTYLRMASHRFVANARQSAGRLKRGGAVAEQPLDLHDLAGSDGDAEADAQFRREWIRSVFDLARTALRDEATANDRLVHLALFEEYDLSDRPDAERTSYAQLADRHGLTDSQVINHLAWARRRFRSHVLEVLRRLAGSDAEYREDVRDLLGIEAP